MPRNFMMFLLIIVSANLAYAIPEAPVSKVMPHSFASRENFFMSTKAKLADEDTRVDYLRLDTNGNEDKLAKIDDELRSLHDVINSLGAVREKDLKALQHKVASNFIKLDSELAKIETQNK